MRIGFDAKRAFHNASGLGNYSRDVLRILARHGPHHTYVAYNPKPARVRFLEPLYRTVIDGAALLGRCANVSLIWRASTVPIFRKVDR